MAKAVVTVELHLVIVKWRWALCMVAGKLAAYLVALLSLLMDVDIDAWCDRLARWTAWFATRVETRKADG